MKQYILNKETQKIELRFTKAEYKALPEADKKEIKGYYLFSGSTGAWVSRSTNNHYSAIRIAEKLGFTDGGKVGERLTYAEQLERKTEKAEARAERFEQYSDNAERRAESLQSGFNQMRGDWSWVTQPNINSSGGRAFTRSREKIMARYDRGFDEYRKSEYFKDRAATAQATADRTNLQNKTYLNNRIEEGKAACRDLERRINQISEGQEQYLENLLERMEVEMDKLAFFGNCLEEAGGIGYSRENVKPGYLVKARGEFQLVLKANEKTVELQSRHMPFGLKYPYAEIREVRIPEGWTDPAKAKPVNPFAAGDILTATNIGGDRIIIAVQVVKATDKNVVIQRIEVKDEKPVPGALFKGSNEQFRRAVKQDHGGTWRVGYDEYKWLYKFTGKPWEPMTEEEEANERDWGYGE